MQRKDFSPKKGSRKGSSRLGKVSKANTSQPNTAHSSSSSEKSADSVDVLSQKVIKLIDLNQVPNIPALLTPKTYLDMINNAYIRSCKLIQASHHSPKKADQNIDLYIKNIAYVADVLELLAETKEKELQLLTETKEKDGISRSKSKIERVTIKDQKDIEDKKVRDWLKYTFQKQDATKIKLHVVRKSSDAMDHLQAAESLTDFPRYEFISQEGLKCLSETDDWNFNPFKLHSITGDKTLQSICYYLFNRHGLLNKFRIRPQTFINYFHQIELGYLENNNPFHNNIHATDVIHCCHYILSQTGILNYYSNFDIFAAFFNCAIHDFQNNGFSDLFHIQVRSDLSILYNDKFINCNNNTSKAFMTAYKVEGCNIFEGMTFNEYRKLRSLIIDLSYSYDFTCLRERSNDLMKANRSLTNIPMPLLRHIGSVCDLGHCAKSFDIHSIFSAVGLEQFFKLGDEQKKHGLEVGFMCDRNVINIVETHSTFLREIVEKGLDLLNTSIEKLLSSGHNHSPDVQIDDSSSDISQCDMSNDPSTTGFFHSKASHLHVEPPWTYHVKENILKWTSGGIFEKAYQKAYKSANLT